MIPVKVNSEREREIARELGNSLEDCFKEAKKIDYQIARSLNHGIGFLGYLGRIPVLGQVITEFRAIKPLDHLESELRTSLNKSLVSLVNVGKKAKEEKERISDLEKVYQIAIDEDWDSKQFIDFIEKNTDLDYIVSSDGNRIDMKEIFAEVDSRLPSDKRIEKKKEYLDWLQNHATIGKQYVSAMESLCFVGCELVGGMSRSYFDITSLRGGMEEIRKTLTNLGRGGAVSMTSQQVLRQYGTAYVDGMRKLLEQYKQVCNLKEQGSQEFNSSLQILNSEILKTQSAIAPVKSNRVLEYSSKN